MKDSGSKAGSPAPATGVHDTDWEAFPGLVFIANSDGTQARALSRVARQLAGDKSEDLAQLLPDLTNLAPGSLHQSYRHPADPGRLWTLAVTEHPGGLLVVGLETARTGDLQRLNAIEEARFLMNAGLREEELLTRIVDLARQVSGATYGALGIFGPDRRLTRFIATGLSPEERERIGNLPVGHGVLGALRLSDRPIRVPDVSEHPEFHGFPPNHPPMRSFLGVPLRIHGRNVGSIYLTEKHGGPFTEEDERSVVALAAYAAAAIENAKLMAQARRLAVSHERDRIARELHDGVIQAVYAMGLRLELLSESAEGELKEELERSVDRLNELIQSIREFISGLNPVTLSVDGFDRGLDSIVAESSVSGLVIQQNIDSDAVRLLNQEEATHVLQFMREALSNVRRHARADSATVDLSLDDGRIRVSVIDDGVGFDPAQARAMGSQGLNNLASRAASLDGQLLIQSLPGEGTKVLLTFSPRGTDE